MVTDLSEVPGWPAFPRPVRCSPECTNATFESRDALLDGRLGGVHDPRVDVAQFLGENRSAAWAVSLKV